MKPIVLAASSAVLITLGTFPAGAAALRAAVLGCKLPADTAKAASLKAMKKTNDLEALTSRRACLQFAKGITVDVDETKLPLSCIRLTGDLECYWVPDSVLDQFPSEKGGGGPTYSGHRRR